MNPAFRQECRYALRAVLLTVPGMPRDPSNPTKLNLAKPNRDFTPRLGVAWVREGCTPGPEQLKSLPATGGKLRTQGTYFLDVFLPENEGEAASDTLVGNLRLAFRPSTKLRYNNQSLTVVRFAAANGLNKDGWYHIPITIAWYADDTN